MIEKPSFDRDVPQASCAMRSNPPYDPKLDFFAIRWRLRIAHHLLEDVHDMLLTASGLQTAARFKALLAAIENELERIHQASN
jgi:hypothetical protein